MRSRVEVVGAVRLIPGKSTKRSGKAAPSQGQVIEMVLFGMLKSRACTRYAFSLYSSRFEEELASDSKLSTYLGITFIESHREKISLRRL